MEIAKHILGLDLGTNSIGWALITQHFEKKEGTIIGLGSRIIPMTKDVMDKFGSGVSISQTAERTHYRGVRRLIERHLLRRERLHRALNVLNFLPEHYATAIDFEKRKGQFKPEMEVKLNYKRDDDGKFAFLFKDSFHEMVKEFKEKGVSKIPYDWTLYYLRKKALSQKITKEELAWILLNFNQKRGYYQLRGEEEETPENKEKEFVVLEVQELIDSGEKVKGNPLYDVIFTNGWQYDKQITKTEDWIGKQREFIVTTTTNKKGDIKRSFKKVDSEKDWIAIKKKTEKDLENSGKTVGEYIYGVLLKNPSQKIRGKLIKTIDRKYYKKELTAILTEQKKHHPELHDQTLYDACLKELYPRNEAHQNNIKDKDITYLFIEDILFYQRPLKSKKSTISDCPYEHRNFLKDGEKQNVPLKCIPKSHPLFQEFRLWQFIRNLKIYQKEAIVDGKTEVDQDVTHLFFETEEDKTSLFDFLNARKEVEQKNMITYLVDLGKIDKTEKDNYRWNYVEDKKYPCNTTRSQFVSRLQKVEGVNVNSFLNRSTEKALWHIVYSVKDKKEFEKALVSFAKKNKIDIDSFVNNFKKFPPFTNDYGAYSEKAIKKLLPLMRLGKYWNADDILPEAKQRISDVMERLKAINFDKDKIDTVTDDALQKQLLKSFIEFKNQNPLKGLNTYQACYAVYERHSEAEMVLQWTSPEAIENYLKNIFKQHSLRNPIVEQVVTETLRVVKDIWEYYGDGEANFFDEIHVELGRDMKNDKKTRERISKTITENENTNERIKSILRELQEEGVEHVRPYSPSQQEILKIYEEGVYNNARYNEVSEEEVLKIRRSTSPSKKDIERYKLWLEQGYISPYTGQVIPLSKLFTTAYQIEHIIPQSRYFDNSLSNKIICESSVNEYKGNNTAYEFIKNHGTERVDIGEGKSVEIYNLATYEAHCNHYFKNNRGKLKYLLSEEIPEGFINRQLTDNRYISKLVKGLLSNIVREKDEKQATSKHLLPISGAITSKLKKDWGLNDKWNEIITPRFERLNKITDSEDYGFWDQRINTFRIRVPDAIAKDFSKKRIDHRHHALDALVIACTTREHINYITSLNTQRKNYSLVSKLRAINEKQVKDKKTGALKTIKVAGAFHLPWEKFPVDAKMQLEKTVVSFKQNLRVINRTNNKTWYWEKENGQWKKKQKKQKGKNFSIRKSMHKETVSGKVNFPVTKGKIATATRVSLSEIKNDKHIEKITDSGIRKILEKHLENYRDENGKAQFDLAFGPHGIEILNKNIVALNGGKAHQPIYKVRLYEVGNKFVVGETGNKKDKYVEAAKGTNLFFAIYWDDKKEKRVYETVPLNEVIAHQKQNAHVSEHEKTPIPIRSENGQFLFSLSPNDLVYIPTEEERDTPNLVNLKSISKEQVNRVYKMVSTTQNKLQCRPAYFSDSIIQNEVGSNNKTERFLPYLITKKTNDINDEPIMIKEYCWKLKVDRLGNITHIIK